MPLQGAKSLEDFVAAGYKKCVIVGFCQTSRELAPYEDGSYVIIGLNRGAIFMPRADVWYDMHGMHIIGSQDRRPGRHVDFLRQFKGPVYVHQRFDDLADNQVAYPLKRIADDIGRNIFRIGKADKKGVMVDTTSMRDVTGEPYLASSIAYELAHAIVAGFGEIHLYGVDLNTDAEYAWQKPGVEHLLGLAAGRGIKVVLPDNCPLLKGTLYGRGFMSERGEVMSYDQLAARAKTLQAEGTAIQQEIAKINGAMTELDFLQSQLIPGIDHERLDDRKKQMQQASAQLAGRFQQVSGSLKETAYWLHQTMQGQQPDEAIQQILAKETAQLTEGPETDLDQLQSVDPKADTYVPTFRESPVTFGGQDITVAFAATPELVLSP